MLKRLLLVLNLLFCNYSLFSEEAMILYISRGLLSSLAEAKDVMTTIAVLNGKISHKVIINTYAVIDGRLITTARTSTAYERISYSGGLT